jgi:hypothetical protein
MPPSAAASSFVAATAPTPVGMMSPMEAYCQQQDPALHYCEAWGSCTAQPQKCPTPPFEGGAMVPGIDACLRDGMAYCGNYSMPEQVLACRNGVSYSQRPRVLIDPAGFQSMTLFTDAFLDGVSRARKCHAGVMPYFPS